MVFTTRRMKAFEPDRGFKKYLLVLNPQVFDMSA